MNVFAVLITTYVVLSTKRIMCGDIAATWMDQGGKSGQQEQQGLEEGFDFVKPSPDCV